MLGVGAAFDFLAGTKPQAPRWMMPLGLEWLFRLATEPRRLWRRYLWHNPRFIVLFALQLLGWKTAPASTEMSAPSFSSGAQVLVAEVRSRSGRQRIRPALTSLCLVLSDALAILAGIVVRRLSLEPRQSRNLTRPLLRLGPLRRALPGRSTPRPACSRRRARPGRGAPPHRPGHRSRLARDDRGGISR